MKTDFVLFLKNEFHQRAESNPNFSLRAFAKRLNVSSGSLCELFQNKRTITLNLFEKIIPFFELEPAQVERFRTWVKNSIEEKATFNSFNDEQAALFNSPLHAALIELLSVENFQEDVEALAQALNISPEKCQNLLNLFMEHNIICFENGRYQRSKGSYFTWNALPKTYFIQVIENAHDKVEKLDISEYMTLASAYAINKKDLPYIKQEISNFNSKLTYWNERREDKDSVFFLNINFTPY